MKINDSQGDVPDDPAWTSSTVQERWREQCIGEENCLYGSGSGHPGSHIPAELTQPTDACTVQILRSIDERSAKLNRGVGYPALRYKKGRPIDMSILSGYLSCALFFVFKTACFRFGSPRSDENRCVSITRNGQEKHKCPKVSF